MKSGKGQKKSGKAWGALTIAGVFFGSAGFIAQFVGLRGLSWPCSISQLVATLIMALLRAGVRRRLGKIPLFCPAFSQYELDFLATRIVFKGPFREFDYANKQKIKWKDDDPKKICVWKVRTPPQNSLVRFTLPGASDTVHTNNATSATIVTADAIEPIDGAVSAESKMSVSNTVVTLTTSVDAPNASDKMSTANTGGSQKRKTTWPRKFGVPRRRRSDKDDGADKSAGWDEASSQQLVLVRERLGNLCKWSNSASEAALTLVRSIERFMATFFPDGETTSIRWVIETTELHEGRESGETDSVVISLTRDTKEKGSRWVVGIGKIESVLSLWIASIEAKMIENADRATTNAGAPGKARRGVELADWRRSQAGIGSKLDYCRVIGDNYEDGVLKRDISWWVGKQIADQADIESDDSRTTAPRGGEKVKLAIGFNGPREGKKSTV